MSWTYFLNLETVALKQAEWAIEQMKDTNHLEDFPDDYPDTEAFGTNLSMAFIALIMMCAYVETCVNTLLCQIEIDELDKVLSKKTTDKIDLIFKDNNRRSAIKGTHDWALYKQAVKARNELVHYKTSFDDTYSSYAPLWAWKIAGSAAGDLFTKTKMTEFLDATQSIVEKMASELNLAVYKEMDAITCGASGLPEHYFYDPNIPYDFEVYDSKSSTN